MAFCLTKPLADKFIEKMKNGEITPEKLNAMEPEVRHKFFAEFLGEDNAKQVNALVESKLVSRNIEQGVMTAVKQILNTNPRIKPGVLEKVQKALEHDKKVQARIDAVEAGTLKLKTGESVGQKILDTSNIKQFKADLVNKIIGTPEVEETKKVIELTNRVKETKAAAYSSGRLDNQKNMEFGRALIDLLKYTEELNQAREVNPILNITGAARSIKVIGDFGALMRNARGLMGTKEWWKTAPEILKLAKSKEAYKEAQAYVISHPNYESAKKGGLKINFLPGVRLSNMEEDFMTNLIAKTPYLRGIERSNVGFMNLLRFARWNTLYEAAKTSGEDMTSVKTLRELAKSINDYTSAGNVGVNDNLSNLLPIANNFIYSLRREASKLNILLTPVRQIVRSEIFNKTLDKIPLLRDIPHGSTSWTARKADLNHFIGYVVTTLIILEINNLAGGKTSSDLTNSDFGKAVQGKRRADISGGILPTVVLLSRLIEGKTTSSASGKITKVGFKYGQKHPAVLGWDYLRNKLAPTASALVDIALQQDQNFQKPTVLSTVDTLIVPMLTEMLYQNIKDAIEHNDNITLDTIFTLMDYAGNGTQLYK